VASYLTERFPYLRKFEVQSIHPGVHIEPYGRSSTHDPRVVTITARLSENKGHDILLLAAAKLKKEGFRFQCRIVGSGSEEQVLREFCEVSDLNDTVIFTGFTTDVPSQLAQADIYAFPALKEGLGISLQEAMGAGLPCIAKRGSGPDENGRKNDRTCSFLKMMTEPSCTASSNDS
jgi:glycosyltransferase involved in cell wall biosynthesis